MTLRSFGVEVYPVESALVEDIDIHVRPDHGDVRVEGTNQSDDRNVEVVVDGPPSRIDQLAERLQEVAADVRNHGNGGDRK